MSNDIVYKYLNVKGFTDEQIALILEKEIERNRIEKFILDYVRELKSNGFSDTEALDYFGSFVRMQKLAEEKMKEERKVGMK